MFFLLTKFALADCDRIFGDAVKLPTSFKVHSVFDGNNYLVDVRDLHDKQTITFNNVVMDVNMSLVRKIPDIRELFRCEDDAECGRKYINKHYPDDEFGYIIPQALALMHMYETNTSPDPSDPDPVIKFNFDLNKIEKAKMLEIKPDPRSRFTVPGLIYLFDSKGNLLGTVFCNGLEIMEAIPIKATRGV